MNKELEKITPLQALNDLRNSGLVKDDVVCFTKKALEKRLDIIESALKEYDSVKRLLNREWVEIVNDYKKARALEIIKEKRVDVGWLISCENIEQYNNVIGTATHKMLTQEEYDLLKEILENE